jgi:1,4-alpha-glucan branching enzyme
MLKTRLDQPFLLHDPHQYLGRHPLDELFDIFIEYRPGFKENYIQVDGSFLKMEKSSQEGVFYALVKKDVETIKVYHASSLLSYDPYTFLPQITDVDQYLFSKGVHYEIYKKLGSHVHIVNGIKGVLFAVWAPSAKNVCLLADFNHFCTKTNPMRSLGASGIWELFVPGLEENEKYKFAITTGDDRVLIKTDPYANAFELRPKNAACVFESKFVFSDELWMQEMAQKDKIQMPINCYEVHLGSWKKGLGFKELAFELGSYVKVMGYTHIELMPIMEHPLDESWGYQVTGFFAPSSRWGNLDDFKFFVNYLHNLGIGVICDWVPAHFPSDDFALAQFDGTALYEHEDPKKGFHPHWNTLIFNYGRHEVINFLIASCLFWLKECHVDGMRVDAVASMLYLDYGKEEGQWIPNKWGGKENLEAIEFLKHLNSIVKRTCPHALMIAEESTSFTGVTHDLVHSGLGFDFKWNMGWMNDTLRYFSHDPYFRKYHQNLLTFGMIYAFSEKFQYVLSHDEVVHGKKSLLSKMPGDLWQRFANLRLLYTYMMTLPGKKLLFMGQEIGDFEEWSEKRSVSFHLLSNHESQGLKELVKSLNHFYKSEKALYLNETSYEGFSWVSIDDHQNSVIAYLRKAEAKTYLIVLHFTPQVLKHYDLYIPYGNKLKMIFCSDDKVYGGSGVFVETHFEKCKGSDTLKATLTIPPLSGLIFELV